MPSSRRDRKREENRRLIYLTARQLFHEQGFERTTVQQIAEVVDVAVQTVFNHAPSKEALFFLDRVPFAEALTRSLHPAADQSWADALVENLAGATIGYLRSLADPIALDMARQIEATPSLARQERVLHAEAERGLGGIIADQLPATDGPLAAALLLATTRVHAHVHRQRLLAGEATPEDLDRVAHVLPVRLRAVLAVASRAAPDEASTSSVGSPSHPVGTGATAPGT